MASKQGRETWRIFLRARLDVTDITSAQFCWAAPLTLCLREGTPSRHVWARILAGSLVYCVILYTWFSPSNPPRPHCKWSWWHQSHCYEADRRTFKSRRQGGCLVNVAFLLFLAQQSSCSATSFLPPFLARLSCSLLAFPAVSSWAAVPEPIRFKAEGPSHQSKRGGRRRGRGEGGWSHTPAPDINLGRNH